MMKKVHIQVKLLTLDRLGSQKTDDPPFNQYRVSLEEVLIIYSLVVIIHSPL